MNKISRLNDEAAWSHSPANTLRCSTIVWSVRGCSTSNRDVPGISAHAMGRIRVLQIALHQAVVLQYEVLWDLVPQNREHFKLQCIKLLYYNT